MPARKPLALRIVASLFVVSFAAVPLTCRLLRPPAAVPRTLTELTKVLSQAAPELYVLPQPNGLEDGVWICTRPYFREQLAKLLRVSEAKYAHRWQGIVYCEKMAEWNDTAEDQLQYWDKYGMRIGLLVLFGDPILLQRIQKTILDHPA